MQRSMKSVTAETDKQRWEREVLEPALEKSPERAVPFTTISGRPIDRLYTADDLAGLRLRARPQRSGRVSLHARHPPDRLPRQALDDAAVRRLRHAGGDQRALQDAAGGGRHRPERRVRSADADGPRSGPRALARRGRQVRRQHRVARRHGAAVRRHPARRHHDVDDDQLAGADDLRDVPGRSPRSRAPTGGRSRARSRTTSSRSSSRRRSTSSRRASRCGSSPTSSRSARRKCRAGTRSRSAGTTSARRARRRCRSWRSRCATASSTCSTGIDAGLDVDDFAPRISFFFNSHSDFFEEIAKFRAARKIWAEVMRDRFGARDERSWKLRFHTQTAGVSLTAQQPYNNVVRTALQALAAVLGGTNSLHTNSLDEALALPTAEAATLALRTQQIIAHESGVTNMVDPLGGSYFVERLTRDMEARRAGVLRHDRPDGRDGRGDRAGLPAAGDRRGVVPLPAGGRAPRQDHRRRQRLRAGGRAADPDPLHRRDRRPRRSWRGSRSCGGRATTTRVRARARRAARDRARAPATRCRRSSTASAPTRRSARCATRCARCGASTRKCRSSERLRLPVAIG